LVGEVIPELIAVRNAYELLLMVHEVVTTLDDDGDDDVDDDGRVHRGLYCLDVVAGYADSGSDEVEVLELVELLM
jgi:hypothetical protein